MVQTPYLAKAVPGFKSSSVDPLVLRFRPCAIRTHRRRWPIVIEKTLRIPWSGSRSASNNHACRIALGALVWILAVWMVPEARSQLTTYNVSAFAPGSPATDAGAQAAFLNAVASAGYSTFFEGFTSSPWNAARSSITEGESVAASIQSQGITWCSSAGDFITTSAANSGVTPWHLYSVGGTPEEALHAVPATLIGESVRPLYGIGVWVGGGPPLKGKLNVILDDARVAAFQQNIGYDSNVPPEPIKETIRLDSTKQFFGVLDPQGFTKFQLLETEGVLSDQVLMWTADVTFAYVPEPRSVSGVALGLVGIAGIRLRRAGKIGKDRKG